MENAETTKEWFVTHEGKQFGPVSAGDLEGLLVKNEVAQAEEKRKAEPQPIGVSHGEVAKGNSNTEGEWGGSSRGAYLFVCYLLPVLTVAGIGAGGLFLQGKADNKLLALGGAALALVFMVFALMVTVNRFTNLAMTRWGSSRYILAVRADRDRSCGRNVLRNRPGTA